MQHSLRPHFVVTSGFGGMLMNLLASEVSIIIPIADNETEWESLLLDFARADMRDMCEIVFSGPTCPAALASYAYELNLPRVRWVESPLGRGRQLNLAARAAQGEWLWFIHADTRIKRECMNRLLKAMHAFPERILYFDLKFRRPAPYLMRLNELGVWWRTRVFGMPFGDQALCVSKKVFEQVGGFDEKAPFGEDHLFVWSARQQGVRLNPVGAYVETSARKYTQKGWFRTTLNHLRLTYQQAYPEWLKLRKVRR